MVVIRVISWASSGSENWPAARGVDIVGYVRLADQRDGIGEGERGALPLRVVRGLLPGGDGIQALLTLAALARVGGVHVNAVDAAVELGGTDPHEFLQRRLQALSGGGIQRDHRLVPARRQ